MISSVTIDSPRSTNVISNNLSTYENSTYKIKVQYPHNWIKLSRDIPGQVVSFFSPISGPYLLHKEYSISIDIPSVYENPFDYITRIKWDVGNQSWDKTIEEAFLPNSSRIINTEPYPNFFKEGKNYVILPLDLSILNFPDQH
jgi:hypothetical protein